MYTIGLDHIMYEYPDIHHYYTVTRTGSVTDVMTSPVPTMMIEGETPSLVDGPCTYSLITMHYPLTTIMICTVTTITTSITSLVFPSSPIPSTTEGEASSIVV